MRFKSYQSRNPPMNVGNLCRIPKNQFPCLEDTNTNGNIPSGTDRLFEVHHASQVCTRILPCNHTSNIGKQLKNIRRLSVVSSSSESSATVQCKPRASDIN